LEISYIYFIKPTNTYKKVVASYFLEWYFARIGSVPYNNK
jgi:hypothetical protein